MKHDVALKVAEALVEHLRPGCVRIEVAGSVRRGKPEVKDIELVCVPDLTPVKRAPLAFGQPIPRLYECVLDKLVDEMRQDKAVFVEADGERYKKLYLNYAGIRCDLFVVRPPAQWGVQMVIRTGPSDFSHWLVSSRKIGGGLPVGYFVKHGCVWVESQVKRHEVPDDPRKAAGLLAEGNHLALPEEADVLRLVGLGWVEPGERVAKWSK